MMTLKSKLLNIKSNILFLALSVGAIQLLTSGMLYSLRDKIAIISAAAVILLSAMRPQIMTKQIFANKGNRFSVVCAVLFAFFAAFNSYRSIKNNTATFVFVKNPAALSTFLLIAILILLFLCAVPVFSAVFVKLSGVKGKKISETAISTPQNRKSDIKMWLFCLLTAAVVLSVCTKSSIAYPFNDWVDANCFFTVGKSMANGKVLYRDIYEQKGPFLYLLHTLAYIISNDTFVGVFLLEILSGSVFLFFAYKTARLYVDRGVELWIPFLAVAVYTSRAFCHGDSAEELCLPFFAVCIYLSERSFRYKKSISSRQWFLVGVMAGAVLLIKFNLLGFFVGWAIVVFYRILRDEGLLKLIKNIGFILAGVCLFCLPFMIYFICHRALSDFFTAYFYNNLFLYAEVGVQTASSPLSNLRFRMIYFFVRNAVYHIPAFIGILWYTLSMPSKRRFHPLVTSLCTILFIFSGRNVYEYYDLTRSVFIIYGFVLLCILAERILPEKSQGIVRTLTVFSVVAAFALSAYLSPNTYLVNVKKHEMPQYQFKKIITSISNPTLLNYGFLDGGFYTVCDIVPNEKFFCKLNIPLSEMDSAQIQSVQEEKTDFVVTRSSFLNDGDYICIAASTMRFENYDWDYYLYASPETFEKLVENGTINGELELSDWFADKANGKKTTVEI